MNEYHCVQPILFWLMCIQTCLPFKCPPTPTSFKTYDEFHPIIPLPNSCDEIDQYYQKQSNKFFSCHETNHKCRWDVVNLGLEKTGTSEIANLLRLLKVSNLTFASPRGVASGLKVLESCACDENVRFVLTTRNLLDMIVSRMAYHHWSCEEKEEGVEPITGNESSHIIIPRNVRCGGMDPACCWRLNPMDMIQSWTFCRDAYHLNIIDILIKSNALDRLLIINIALEGEHHAFRRLKHFIQQKETFSQIIHFEKIKSHQQHSFDNSMISSSSSDLLHRNKTMLRNETDFNFFVHNNNNNNNKDDDDKSYKIGKNGIIKPIKILRRKTNKQAYPIGLKNCLKNYAQNILISKPLNIQNKKLNHPLLSLQGNTKQDLHELMNHSSSSLNHYLMMKFDQEKNVSHISEIRSKLLEIGLLTWEGLLDQETVENFAEWH